jgi:hypothetical protein
MTWDSVQQVLRIILNAGGAYLVGKGVVTEEMSVTLVGGLLSVGSVMWWIFWDKNRAASA